MATGTVLITGTAGFIGYHLAEAMLAGGWRVVGYDNFNDYYDVRLKEARHRRLEARAGYRGVRADLCDGDALRRLFGEEPFTQVIHLAAQAGVRYSLEHPMAYVRSNLEGFVNVLEAVRHAGVPRLIYASSSSVYGGNTKLPFSEGDSVDRPVSLYAATKKANELMAHAYSHLYGMQTVGLRFFTVYGPWGRPDMAMWIFADKIARGEPIPVFNHGEMRRDFTYVADVVKGILGAVGAPDLGPCEVFNLGNHRSERLLDLIAAIERAVGRQAVLQMLPMQPGDVPATYADIELARRRLGFEPTTPISQGVPEFVRWFMDYTKETRAHA
ncbi:MAG: UDP-glucose 4-epimerase [Lentisphaerae bacterium ADurb.BinA184]|nr:MAG: UDP-glucose 4-epimerase [Lentisphaerae bacterium ADurb.BinA184]